MKTKMLSIPCAALLLAIALPATAGEPATVSYQSGEETISGYLALPSGQGPFPAVLVIHEWWGLNENVKGEARKLAEAGYAALAVDLYRGHLATSSDEAHELSRGLPEDRARRDLLAAFDFLAARKDVRKDRIGSIGWCMGGGYSLALAVHQPKLAAAVIYYGRLVTDEALLKQIQAPVLGLFGEDDRGIPVAGVREFESAMKRLGKAAAVHTYAGAGHAFANAERPSYRAEAARDAAAKTADFFAKYLKGN